MTVEYAVYVSYMKNEMRRPTQRYDGCVFVVCCCCCCCTVHMRACQTDEDENVDEDCLHARSTSCVW